MVSDIADENKKQQSNLPLRFPISSLLQILPWPPLPHIAYKVHFEKSFSHYLHSSLQLEPMTATIPVA